MKLDEIFKQEDVRAQINELKKGRPAPEPDYSKFKAELDPKQHEVFDMIKRPDKKVKIDKPENSGQAINVTTGVEQEEETRLEPVARIAVALQKLIVKRAASFTFGNPIELNADTETENEKVLLKALKRILYDIKEVSHNRKIARAIFSITEAAELWFPVERTHSNYGFNSKFKLKVMVFSPIFGDKLYPFFDETGDMVAFSREFKGEHEGKEVTFFETWTDKDHRLFVKKEEGWALMDGYPKPISIGKIPVVWGRQEDVEWQDVQWLIDRLEKLLSNFADTNDYHASPKIFITGEITGFAKKGESGAIIQGDENATAQYLSWANAPESVKLEIDTLLRLIHTITQTPDISFDSVKGIGSISGVALKLLFMDAHLKVQDKMETFTDFLQRRINIIKAFIANMNTSLKSECESLIIEPEIVPFMIDDERAKIDLLVAANGQKPVMSQKTSVSMTGWFQDAESEYSQMLEEEQRESYTSLIEPTY
jgi:SPP1 family phage portal protein